jgi:hypothetical protein
MRTLVLLLLAASALAFARPAGARDLPAPAAPSGPVSAGAWIETPVPRLPAGIEEFELVLLPESGPAIRVSPETRAGAASVRWRMPAVAAGHARLAWRMGGEEGEFESAPSPAFALAPLPGDELARVRSGRSEAGARVTSLAGARPAALEGAADDPVIVAGGATAAAVEPVPPALARPHTDAILHARDEAPAPARPATRDDDSHRPGRVPLRN